MTEHEQVAEIFRAAGWTAGTRDGWDNGFVWAGTSVVGGIDPWGTARTTGIVDNALEGPANIVDAAHWLVEHARGLRLAPVTEPEETPAHEDDAETGGDTGDGEASPGLVRSGDAGGYDLGHIEGYGDRDTDAPADEEEAADLGSEILDADYTDPTDPPPEAHPSGAFIFGDNLEQQRTAAIGLVVQEALTRLPAAIDYSRMSELRNFTMGVSEGRWPDDPAQREELDTLEATERLRRAIEAIRDAKIETLLTATREEIAAFDTGAGWP